MVVYQVVFAEVRQLLIVIALSLLALSGCFTSGEDQSSGERASQAARPNVIVIVVDDLRWDEFAAAGHPYVETPNIDRLANEGAMFTNAFHAVPLCSPNRAAPSSNRTGLTIRPCPGMAAQ